MIDPASGPCLFGTSAEGWLARNQDGAAAGWLRAYLGGNRIHVSVVTVVERIRGFGLLWRDASADRRPQIEGMRAAYLKTLNRVLPLDAAVALVSGEIMAMLGDPPTPPKRSHRFAESRQERQARWRFDVMIAATALVSRMVLIHNNAADFEAIRGAIERMPERFPGLGPLELVRCTGLAVS